ncbi:hypothetical protein [Micromonospora fulviviridis]|uniref:hypothetical protein n=1 Tax=Micromonospora fulviviridis TaxID=47860 RepID=UPI0037B356A5
MRDNRAAHRRHRRAVTGLRHGDREEPLIAPARRAGARPPRHFTVHLGFEAADPTSARELAVAYAEALGLLRPELALGAAALSPADAWHRPERALLRGGRPRRRALRGRGRPPGLPPRARPRRARLGRR